MTNIVRGFGTALAVRVQSFCKSTLPAPQKCNPVLLAARRFRSDSCFLHGPGGSHGPAWANGSLSDSAMRGFPFASQGLDVLHCHADARLAKGADAEAAVQAAFETLGPERITRSTPDLPACLAELPALPLCNEQGQLRALPMAAVLRQLSSVMQARDTDLARLSDRTAGPIRCERQMFAMPGWLRKASNFDQVRLRKERTKVREAAQELNCWAQCLADSGDVSVSLADASELSKSLDALMRRVWRSDSRIEEALRRLQVQVEGSVATQYRTSVEDLLYRKYAPYRHPGARSEWRLDAGVGAAAGTAAGVDSLSVGATAGATFGVSRVRALGNDDEGFVQESCGVTRSVAAHVATSLSGAAKALLSAKALTQKTVYVEYDGIRHLVESPDSRVQRARFREIGKLFRHAPFKVRSLGDLTRRQNDAAFQEASLARATGGIELPTEDDAKAIHRVHTGLRAPVQKPPAVGVARRIAVQGDAAASIGLPAGFGAQAALSGGVASTRVRHDVLQPFWNAIGGDRPSFRLLDADELDDPARSDSLDMQKRRQAILQGALGLAPALARLGFPEALPPGPTKALVRKGFALSVISDRSHLHRILQRMEDQFDLYCLAGREVASGKREAAALMRDFERIWNVKGRMRETAYVQKVCLAHNAIALRLRQLAVEQRARGDSHAAARWHADWTRLDAFWNKLRTPDLPHRQVRLLPHIAFRDILCPSSTERHVGLSFSASGSWSLAGSTTGLGVAANVSVSASFRQVRHPNYLREGDYIDLKFDFGGSGVVAAQYGAVLQALNGLSSRLALPPELLEHAFLLTGTTPLIAASVEGGVQLMLRLFRPAFRTDPDAAYRLQFARVLGTQGGGCSIGKVTVPIGPASASVEAGGRVRHTRLLDEWLGEDTLTYVMLRYNRMRIRAPFDDEGEWSDFVVRHRKAFEKMFARLGDVDSAVCKEAQFMMDQLALGARKADRPAALAERDRFGEAMRRYRSSRSGLDFYNARVCFEQMLARQLTRWQEVRVAARRHWELDDRIRFVS